MSDELDLYATRTLDLPGGGQLLRNHKLTAEMREECGETWMRRNRRFLSSIPRSARRPPEVEVAPTPVVEAPAPPPPPAPVVAELEEEEEF